jgi:hypothetical protein
MLECLLIKMRGIWQMVEGEHEKMKANIKTRLEIMNDCLEDMRANQKKLEAKMETSIEKTEAAVQHYNWAPFVEATCMVTDPQGLASDVLC